MSESPDGHRVLVVDDEPNIVDVVAMATDAGRIWFLTAVGLVIVPATVLLGLRHSTPSPTPTPR